MPRHGDTFIEARYPKPVYLEPEPVWILDNYRVKRWYYRAAPDIGEKVHYLQDGFGTRVSRVTPFAIYFEDSNVMRRPQLGRRMLEWSLPRLHSLTTRLNAGRSSASSTRTPNRQVILL